MEASPDASSAAAAARSHLHARESHASAHRKNLHLGQSRRSRPSKIHGSAPLNEDAAFETLLSTTRARKSDPEAHGSRDRGGLLLKTKGLSATLLCLAYM